MWSHLLYKTCKYEIHCISNDENMHERMTNEGGGGGTQSLWEKHAPRDKTPLKWNNFANIGTIDLIFVSLYS